LTWKIEAQLLLDNVSSASLATLRRDTNQVLVSETQVGGVDGNVRHLPCLPASGLVRLPMFDSLLVEALLDSVLVSAGEGGEDQITRVGIAGRDDRLVAFADEVGDFAEVTEVEFRRDSESVEVKRERDDVNIASAFSITEKAAFDSLATSQDTQLSGSDTGTSVIVWVKRSNDVFSIGDIRAEVLDLVGIVVRRSDFHGGREVKHDAVVTRPGLSPGFEDGLAQLHGEVILGLTEGLHTVVELEVSAGPGGAFVCQLTNELDGVGDEFERLLA